MTAKDTAGPDSATKTEVNIQKAKFEVYGEEMIEKTVKLSGNSGRVLPASRLGG